MYFASKIDKMLNQRKAFSEETLSLHLISKEITAFYANSVTNVLTR